MTKKIIIWFVIILLIFGGVFGYLYYLQMPERIVQKMIKRMSEVKFVEYVGQIQINNIPDFYLPPLLSGEDEFLQLVQSSLNKQERKIFIDLNGAFDLSNFNNPKAMIGFSTDLLLQKIGMESRIVDKAIYLKIDNIPDLKLLDLNFLENQGVKVDLEIIKNQFVSMGLIGQSKEAQKEQGLSSEQIEQLKKVIAQAKIFKGIEKMSREEINGVDTHHFRVLIDRDGLTRLLAEKDRIIQNKILTEEELKALIGWLGALDSIKSEIWIGKEDLLLYRIDIRSVIEGVKSEEMFTASIQFKNYDKSVQINVPTSVRILEDVLNEFPEELIEEALRDNSVKFDLE